MVTHSEPQPTSLTVFVTGASGFVGRRLVQRLHESTPHQIRALVRQIPPRAPTDVTWIHGDLLRPETYDRHLSGVDVVVHLGAAVGRCPESEFFAVNGAAFEQLLERCRSARVRRALMISTIAAGFDDLDHYPYARSKLQAELLVQSSGMSYQIVRPTIIVGPDGPGWHSLRKLATLPITPVFGSGSHSIQPIDVDDVVTCLVELINEPTDETLIELGGRESITMIGFLQRIKNDAAPEAPFRAIRLPYKAIAVVLGALEAVFGHRLPMTRGQLAVFGNDSTVRPSRFHELHRDSMQSVDQMIARSNQRRDPAADPADPLWQECNTFSRYLVGLRPTPAVWTSYQQAHEQGIVRDTGASPWDRRLVRLARSRAWLCKLIDSYCRFLAPDALLRRKLVLLLAQWECEPISQSRMQLREPVGAVWVGLRIGFRMISSGIFVMIAMGILAPFRWLARHDSGDRATTE